MRIFKGLGIYSKIVGLTLVSVIPLLLVGIFYILPIFEKALEGSKTDNTRNLVEVAIGILEEHGAKVRAGEMTLAEAQARASAQVETLRYNRDDYFWIHNLDNIMLMHPFVKDLVGKDQSGLKDKDGKLWFIELTEKARQGGGMVRYLWPKPGSDAPVPKISYVKLYEPWGWIVGTGVYVDDLDIQIRGFIIRVLSTLFIVVGIALFVAAFVLRSVKSGLLTISSLAGEVTSSSSQLSSSSQSQSAAVEEATASLQELIASIQDIAENASNVSNAAHDSVNQAQSGQGAVQQAVDAMNQISQSSQKINDIIGVISEIAEQTNLLALNASIESARAGEHGKGFAVVADEVRKLAERSAKAASEIGQLIKESSELVGNGVELSHEAGQMLGGIIEHVNRTAEMVEQISAATEEQAATSSSIKDGINQISVTANENSVFAATLADSAQNMTHQIASIVQGKSSDDSSPMAPSNVSPSMPPAPMNVAASSRALIQVPQTPRSNPIHKKTTGQGEEFLDW